MKRHSLLIAPAVLVLTGSMNLQAEGWLDSIKSFIGGEAEEVSASVVDASKQSGQNIADAVKGATTDAVKNTAGEQMATAVSLVSALTEQLGITPEQASAGLGAILGQAKSNLNGDQLTSLKSAIPNMDELIASVPAVIEKDSAAGGLMDKAASLMGNSEEVKNMIQGAGQTIKQFQAAGLDPSMIGKFVGITQSFFSISVEPSLAKEILST